jgi:hypothetical protein
MTGRWLRFVLTQWLTHKLYAAITPFGLVLGCACFLLLLLFVQYGSSLLALTLAWATVGSTAAKSRPVLVPHYE